jgi:transposase
MAAWIADLMAHGLIRASFVPPAPIQELRDLTRARKQLGREIVQHTQRIEKVLEDANIPPPHDRTLAWRADAPKPTTPTYVDENEDDR